VFETGDEQFLKFAKQGESYRRSRIELSSRSRPIAVPIVVVFTQFDKLVSRMEEHLTDEEVDMSDEDIDKLCLQKADAEFEMLCLEPLRKVAPQLEYAKTSGLPDHFTSVSSPHDIYHLSSERCLPIYFGKSDRTHSNSCRAPSGRRCLDRFCHGSKSQRSNKNRFLNPVSRLCCDSHPEGLTFIRG